MYHIPSFKKDRHSFLLIVVLIAGWIKSAKMSAFFLIMSFGTSVSWQDFDACRLTISWSISLFFTLENLKKLFDLAIFSIVFILGWSLYTRIDFKTGSPTSFEIGSDTWYSGILRLLRMVEKKVLKTLAVLLPVLMILSFSIKVIFSSNVFYLREKAWLFSREICCLWFSFHLNYCNNIS